MTSEFEAPAAALTVRLLVLQELSTKLFQSDSTEVLLRARSSTRWIWPDGRLTTFTPSELPVQVGALGRRELAGLGECYLAFFAGPPAPLYLALSGVDLTRSQEFSLAAMFSDVLVGALTAAGYRHELEIQARTDWLTGLANRGALERALISSLPLGWALGIADVDGLKIVNDQQGHPAGDALLRHVAARLADLAAPSGQAFRIGGDEFAVLTDVPHMVVLSEAVEQDAMVSFGWVPLTDGDPDTAIARADEQMYQNRHRRRGAGRTCRPA